MNEPKQEKTEFEQLQDGEQMSIISELILFVIENKAWWMIPFLVALGLVGILVLLSATGVAPFVYTVF